jgi:hypothetical protein
MGLAVLGAVLSFSPFANGQPQFVSYQGELRQDGVPYDGIAFAKFAIVDNAGTTTLWSNDGTSTAGSQPTNSVDLDVVDGVFSVLLGESPMTALTAEALAGSGDAALRVWIDTGTGFEQLTDQPIASSAFALVCESVNQIGINTTSFVPKWTGTTFVSGSMFDNGNVGIGTTTPAGKLDVAGPIAVNGSVVVDATGQWIGAPGIGPPGPPGPTPAHVWIGTNLRFEQPDGTFGPSVNLMGPPPVHQWSGTSLRFMNPDGTFGPYVNLQGPPGAPVTTFSVCSQTGTARCLNSRILSCVIGTSCTVTSDTGTCSGSQGNCPVGPCYGCCVCAPN